MCLVVGCGWGRVGRGVAGVGGGGVVVVVGAGRGVGGGCWCGCRGGAGEDEKTGVVEKTMLSFVEVLRVALEIILYLDLGAVGRLSVGCKALQQLVKECKFGGGQVLLECRRLLMECRDRVSRDVAGKAGARVVHAAAYARSPVCDLVALGWRMGQSSRMSDVKKSIMEVGNRLTELMRWGMHRADMQALGDAVPVSAQIGSDGRGMKRIYWPRTEWGRGVVRARLDGEDESDEADPE